MENIKIMKKNSEINECCVDLGATHSFSDVLIMLGDNIDLTYKEMELLGYRLRKLGFVEPQCESLESKENEDVDILNKLYYYSKHFTIIQNYLRDINNSLEEII